MRRLATVAAALALVALTAGTGLAQPARPRVNWKFTLDFAVQGPQAPFLLALERGYFAAEGINLTIDRGFGSADAVTKIASGAYDLGYADTNSMVEFNVRNPDRSLIAFVMFLNSPRRTWRLTSSTAATSSPSCG